MRTLFISLACAASLLSAQPVFAVPVSRIAAVVNGDMITVRELDKALQPELIGQKIDPAKNPQMVAEVRKAVLDKMINDKILLQEAAKEKIDVSDAEVDAAIDRIVKDSQLDRAVFFKQMEKEGVSEKMFRDRLYVQLVSQRLMGRNVVNKVVVTEDEINDYYRKNMAGFVSGRARVAMLIYPVEADAEKWAADRYRLLFLTLRRRRTWNTAMPFPIRRPPCALSRSCAVPVCRNVSRSIPRSFGTRRLSTSAIEALYDSGRTGSKAP